MKNQKFIQKQSKRAELQVQDSQQQIFIILLSIIDFVFMHGDWSNNFDVNDEYLTDIEQMAKNQSRLFGPKQ